MTNQFRGAAMRIAAIFLLSFLMSSAHADLLPNKVEGWNALYLLEGHWISTQDGSVNEEIWTNNDGNLMLGMNRTRKNLSNSFEFLRIENRKEGVFYLAQPQGAAPPTPFLLLTSSATHLVFSNPANEWPQRIEYRRTAPDKLEATVSGMDATKGRVLKFVWARVK